MKRYDCRFKVGGRVEPVDVSVEAKSQGDARCTALVMLKKCYGHATSIECLRAGPA